MENVFDKRFLSQIGLLTGLGAVLPVIGTAEASLICTTTQCTDSQTFSLTASASVSDPGETSVTTNALPNPTLVTFSQFDPSLGTLTEIDVTLTSTLFGSLSVSAESTSEQTPSTTATTSWDATITLKMPGITDFSDSQHDSVSCNVQNFENCSETKSPNPSFSESDSQTVAAAFFSSYTGNGTVDANLTLALLLSVGLEPSGSESVSANGSGSATWDPPQIDALTVTYKFTPNGTAPEPGTLALIGLGGMAGLGFARRRPKQDG